MRKTIIAQKKHRRAFTLIELVVVMFIMGLLLMVAVPRVGALYDRQLVEQQAQLLEKDLIWLRSEARRSGEKAFFQGASQSYSLTVKDGQGTHTQTKALVSARMVLETSARERQIIFEPIGTAFDKCTVTLRCGAQARTVVVNNLGQIRVGVPT